MHQEAVERAGLTFARATDVPMPEDPEAFFARAFHPLRGPRFVVRDLAADDVAASYALLLPACRDADMVITSTLAFAGHILGETLPVAWMSAALSPAVFISAYDPPATGMRVLDHFFRASVRHGQWLRRTAERVTAAWTAPVRAFRQTLGLPAVSASGDPFHGGQHARDGVLAMYSPLLGSITPDMPAHTTITGFCRRTGLPAALPAGLAHFLDAGSPPLVFTLGSVAVHAGEQFLRESLGAAKRLKRRAVLLTGSEAMTARLGAQAVDVFVTEYAPHAPLFSRAAVVIHHGGVGTSQEALRAGRPMLVVPHGFDQPDNAARLVRLGVADVLPARRYRASRVVKKLGRLLDDEALTQRAHAFARVILREEGASHAADAVESVLRRRQVRDSAMA